MKTRYHIFLPISLLILLNGCTGQSNGSRTPAQSTIVDMAGRQVAIPVTINRIFCADMTCTMFIYSLVPDKLVARNTEATANERFYTLPAFQQLPAVGVIFNGRSTIQLEELIKMNPDLIVCPLFQHTKAPQMEEYERVAKLLNKPFVMVNFDIEQLPDAYRFMGKLLQCKAQAEKLSAYCDSTLAWADSVKRQISHPKSIYVAEGLNGLNTIPNGSTHSQTLSMAGAVNCATVDQEYGFRDITIGFEQIIGWNPQYILINSRSAEQTMSLSIIKSGKWQSLNAVRQHHVLVTPVEPFNWIGRPPGINRIIGIKWLAWSIYPEMVKMDLPKEIKRFFQLFYHTFPSDQQIDRMIKPSKNDAL